LAEFMDDLANGRVWSLQIGLINPSPFCSY
jgi:hypothetical protein